MPHFREEEELLFPRAVEFDEPRELIVEALLEHQRLHGLAARLGQILATGGKIDVRSRRPHVSKVAGAAEGLASDELNATPLSWKAGTGPPEQINEERDVLVVVLEGSATLSIDDEQRELGAVRPR